MRFGWLTLSLSPAPEETPPALTSLLCQTGFGEMSHKRNLTSMRRPGEEVMPAFLT